MHGESKVGVVMMKVKVKASWSGESEVGISK